MLKTVPCAFVWFYVIPNIANCSMSNPVLNVCLFGFYGISTFVGYLMLNPFLYKQTVLFQTI